MNLPTLASFRQSVITIATVAILTTWVAADDDDYPQPQRDGDSVGERGVGDGDSRRDRNRDRPRIDRERGDQDRFRDDSPREGDRDRPRPGDFDRQPPPEPPRGRVPAVVRVLDRNGDHRIDRNELDLAIFSLRQLDRNRDGQLSWEEMMGGPPHDGERPPSGDRPREGDRPLVDRMRERFGRGGESREAGQNNGPPPVEMILRMLDRDGDEAISREEAPERMLPAYQRFDSNDDGKLNADELRLLREQFFRDRSRQERREDPGGARPRRPAAESDEG